jgi:hypothetical protein
MKADSRSTAEHLTTREYLNRKPYRTAAQKIIAKNLARIIDGRWVSTAPVSKR